MLCKKNSLLLDYIGLLFGVRSFGQLWPFYTINTKEQVAPINHKENTASCYAIVKHGFTHHMISVAVQQQWRPSMTKPDRPQVGFNSLGEISVWYHLDSSSQHCYTAKNSPVVLIKKRKFKVSIYFSVLLLQEAPVFFTGFRIQPHNLICLISSLSWKDNDKILV